MLEKYADLLLDGCLNVKKNQPLLISCPIESYEFIRILVQKAYKKGIKDKLTSELLNDIFKDDNSLKNEVISLIKSN